MKALETRFLLRFQNYFPYNFRFKHEIINKIKNIFLSLFNFKYEIYINIHTNTHTMKASEVEFYQQN